MASITRVINLARHNQSSRRDTSFVMSYPNAAPDERKADSRTCLGYNGSTARRRQSVGGEQRAAGMTKEGSMPQLTSSLLWVRQCCNHSITESKAEKQNVE